MLIRACKFNRSNTVHVNKRDVRNAEEEEKWRVVEGSGG